MQIKKIREIAKKIGVNPHKMNKRDLSEPFKRRKAILIALQRHM
jgi:hypothetical protein